MFGGSLNEVALNEASGALGTFFSLSPSAIAATGSHVITASGSGTTWGASNPFSLSAGGAFASISDYVNVSPTQATFTLTVTALSGVITVEDSNSGTSQDITAAAVSSLVILARTPYLSTDSLTGAKGYQLYGPTGVAIGGLVTTDFWLMPLVDNAWYVRIPVTPNGLFGDFSGIARFQNVNGGYVAKELYRPPTQVATSLVYCILKVWDSSVSVGVPGYQIYNAFGAAVGSRVTAGIWAVPGMTNTYAAAITRTPDVYGGDEFVMRWDTGL